MSEVVHPMNIFSYFENVLHPVEANNLHSYCIAVSLHHISTIIKKHNENYQCHCFICLVYRQLVKTLLSRGYKHIFYSVNGKIVKIILM